MIMNRREELSGKRILVTGGTTGIGRETVALLAGRGARILTFGRNREPLEEVLDGVPGVSGLTADVADRNGVAAVFEAVDRDLGGLDILVACAALGAQPIHEMSDEGWRYVVETNLIGYLACARAAIERMRHSGGGHLLFIGSISAELKAPGESVYSATKAGVQAFAEALHKEVAADNIRVSVIQPGSVATDMQQCDEAEKRKAIAHDEMLHAVEIAEAVEFVLTRSQRADVVSLRIEPRMQKTH
jgi:NAD(P)-dependent dehydrogenase (short-subunit alcohol dehydrogenase family)